MQFDAQAVAWQEKLVEINEDNLRGAQSWVRDIQVRKLEAGSGGRSLTWSPTEVIYAMEILEKGL